jgi:anti-anti-sigma factor
MTISVTDRQVDDTTVLVIRGQLDIDGTALLHEALDRAGCRIVVDLSGLTFCDSIGLSALVTTHRRCQAQDGFLRLAEPSPFLLRTLRVVGLFDALPVYRSVAAACSGDPAGLAPRGVLD